MTESQPAVKGACLCGAVTLNLAAPVAHFHACHCSWCRKWSGGPLLAADAGDQVTFDGNQHISTYASSDWAERGFCKICGSSLFYHLKPTGQYFIPMGLLDGVQSAEFGLQMFIDEKPPYYEFANATEQLTGAEVFAQFAAPD